jgi:hemerythrin-like domain-containing protein
MSGSLLASRRGFLGNIAAVGGGAFAALTPASAKPVPQKGADRSAKKEEEDVSPNEDLMREHGVLVRCLVIYRETIRRIDARQDFPPAVISGTATLIRTFVEDYHEKLEEDQLFPRFRKAGKLVDLVDVLYTQHQKGRVVTDRVLQAVAPAALKNADGRQNLRRYLDMFVRMYEPHEAREDTVLFPEFKKIVSPHEYDALGEEFEKKENQLFGGDGFEKNVARVAELEKQLGIYDLATFTPPV